MLIASNETASEHNITLQTNAFIASDERVLYWSGDEYFRAGDKHVENVRSNSSYTHTASYQRLPKEVQLHYTQLATNGFQTELLSR